jgi:hypothetical protein
MDIVLKDYAEGKAFTAHFCGSIELTGFRSLADRRCRFELFYDSFGRVL